MYLLIADKAMNREKGFTLIELLVVISIIALLLSILLPALRNAKELGRTSVCSANQHSLVMAYMLYSEENDSKLCGSFSYHTEVRNWGGPEDWAWAPYDGATDSSIPVGVAPTLEQRYAGIEMGSLFNYTGDLDLYHCPSDRAQRDELKFRSYSIADCMNGEWSHYWKVFKKYTEIKNPSVSYVFVEEDDGRDYNMNSWILMPDTGSPMQMGTLIVTSGLRKPERFCPMKVKKLFRQQEILGGNPFHIIIVPLKRMAERMILR